MPWRAPADAERDYVDAVNGGRVYVGRPCWVIGAQRAQAAVLRGVRGGRIAEVEFPGDFGTDATTAVTADQIIAAAADEPVEAEIVEDDDWQPYPLPSQVCWTVDGGQLVMNLGARDVREWPEIEYRVMSRSGVLSPAEMSGLWEQIKRLQDLGGRLEHGHFVSFAKPDGPLGHDDEPPYDPRL